MYARASGILEKAFDSGHPKVAIHYNNRAGLLFDQVKMMYSSTYGHLLRNDSTFRPNLKSLFGDFPPAAGFTPLVMVMLYSFFTGDLRIKLCKLQSLAFYS